MILFGETKHAAREKDSTAYCLRKLTQSPCVWGDSNACLIKNVSLSCGDQFKRVYISEIA